MNFHRLCNPSKSNSFFLFGARGTGKTHFTREFFGSVQASSIDLLNDVLLDLYTTNPDRLYDEVKKWQSSPATKIDWLVIDEVQKVPKLLDTVHRILENPEFPTPHFCLTGSSARKLRHGGANLLAGRAFMYEMFPLTYSELKEHFDLESVLNWGSLPKIFSLADPIDKNEFLKSYGLTYMREEVWAEHLIHKLEPFRKFLAIAAQQNSQQINYANIGADVGASEKTIKKYFQILEDTLLGFMLEPFSRSIRKRQQTSPKFFFFDLGVKRALEETLRQAVIPNTYAFGRSFEHFIIAEAVRLNSYRRLDYRFSYFRTQSGVEIDLIIERPGLPLALVEIKSSTRVDARDADVVKSIASEIPGSQAFLLSLDQSARNEDGVNYFPWKQGLEELGL